MLWTDCVLKLKPPLSSLRKTSLISIPGFFLSYFNYLYQKIVVVFLEVFQKYQNEYRFDIFEILQEKQLDSKEIPLINQIAIQIQKKK